MMCGYKASLYKVKERGLSEWKKENGSILPRNYSR